MRQFTQDFALAREPLGELLAVRSGEWQLESQRALDHTVTAPGAPDRSHAAAANFFLDDVGAYDSAGRESRNDRYARGPPAADLGQGDEKITGLGCGALFEQLPQL